MVMVVGVVIIGVFLFCSEFDLWWKMMIGLYYVNDIVFLVMVILWKYCFNDIMGIFNFIYIVFFWCLFKFKYWLLYLVFVL